MKRAHRILLRIEVLLSAFSALSLLFIMLAISADAFSRYFLNAPIQGTLEVVGRYLMVAAYFFILSLSYTGNAQIRVDFLIRNFPKRIAHLVEMLVCMSTTILFGLIGWLAATEAIDSFLKGEITSGSIGFIIWPSTAFVAVGSTLLVLRMIVDAIRHLNAAILNNEAISLPFQQD